MGSYFKPWRRKTGVITLVLACVFALGWVRSLSVIDLVEFPIRMRVDGTLVSFGGDIVWAQENHPGDSGWKPGVPEWRSFDRSSRIRPITPLDFETDWNLRFAGFQVGKHAVQGWQHPRVFLCVAPYWSIVIPLTLLSAWLLISKPRKSTPKKIIETVPETAV